MLGLILKLARPRTWAFIILSFMIGWSLTGDSFSFKYASGLVVFVFMVANVNIINAYTDVNEDRINLPQRVKMIEQIGYEKLPSIAAVISVISILISLLIGLQFFAVSLITLFDVVFYSVKPFRFKANPVLSLVSFSGALIFPLFGAWLIGNGLFDIPILFVFLGYSFLVYGTIKNLPDYYGDKEAGLRTSATIFGTRKKAIVAASILLLSPYVLLTLFVALKILECEFLCLFAVFPFIALICSRALTSCDSETLERLHTYGFFYQVGLLSSALFLVSNPLSAIIVFVATLSFIYIMHRLRIDSRLKLG